MIKTDFLVPEVEFSQFSEFFQENIKNYTQIECFSNTFLLDDWMLFFTILYSQSFFTSKFEKLERLFIGNSLTVIAHMIITFEFKTRRRVLNLN